MREALISCFQSIQGCREIVEPICLPAASDDLERCLSVLVEGFLEVEKRLPKLPVAISFAFPPGLLTMSMELLVTSPNFPAFEGRSGTWTLFEGTVWYSGFY